LATIAGTQLSAVEARVLADKWFTKLHAQHKPPGNSILFVGGAANAGSMAVLLGVGNQEASAMFRRAGVPGHPGHVSNPAGAAQRARIATAVLAALAAALGFVVTLLLVFTLLVAKLHARDLNCATLDPRSETLNNGGFATSVAVAE
jgi:hypothetical protein